MNVTEASRTRHLVIRLDRGDELPASLLRALGEAEVRAAWITGLGTLDSAEIVSMGVDGRELRRLLDTPSTAASIEGNAAIEGGVLTLRLAAILARETDLGATLCGGTLLTCVVRSVELHVTAFDDLELIRQPDERGHGVLSGRKHSSVLIASAPEARAPIVETRAPIVETRAPIVETRAPVVEHRAPVVEHRAPVVETRAAVAPTRAPVVETRAPVAEARSQASEARAPEPQLAYLPAGAGQVEQAVLPPKPVKPQDDLDVVYPEVGDAVNHFKFGDCTVILSDGDRIRLRQDRDGQVRELALAMLKVELLSDGPAGQRIFILARKN